MKKTPIMTAKGILSGVSRRKQIDKMEMEAVKPKPKPKPKPAAPKKSKPLFASTYADDRQAKIKAQQDADRAAIAAMKNKK